MEKVTIEERLAQLQRARNMWEWTYGNALHHLQSIEAEMEQLNAQLNNNLSSRAKAAEQQ